jgi:hypothetical protein
MKANVGGLDRLFRLVAGVAILGAGYYFKSWWGLIGILPVLTGTFRFCPAYLPFGLSTCSLKEK